jgi:hypothetical protein
MQIHKLCGRLPVKSIPGRAEFLTIRRFKCNGSAAAPVQVSATMIKYREMEVSTLT